MNHFTALHPAAEPAQTRRLSAAHAPAPPRSLNKQKQKQKQEPGGSRKTGLGRTLTAAALALQLALLLAVPAFAAPQTGSTIWSAATAFMRDVYSQILGISTIVAVVTASVALLLMNFSRSGRTVDESRAWLKRIILTWLILNSLGFIVAYVTPFVNGGQWSP